MAEPRNKAAAESNPNKKKTDEEKMKKGKRKQSEEEKKWSSACWSTILFPCESCSFSSSELGRRQR